jgi:hypothetical protein
MVFGFISDEYGTFQKKIDVIIRMSLESGEILESMGGYI